MRYRSVATLCLAVLFGVAVSATGRSMPAAAEERRLPLLRQRTIVRTGGATAYTMVRAPKPFSVRFEEGFSFNLRGRGRIRGFALAQVGERLLDTAGLVMVAPGYCMKKGCGSPKNPGGGWGVVTGTEGGWILPAGDYLLYVIADGAPLRVKLTFPEFSGNTRIEVRRPAEIDIDSFRTHPVSTPEGSFYMGGGFSDMGGGVRGLAMLKVWALRDTQEPPVPFVWGGCAYYEDEHPLGDLAFAPGCPGAPHEPFLIYGESGPGYVGSFTAFSPVPGGIGGHSSSPAADNAGGAAVWFPMTEALP